MDEKELDKQFQAIEGDKQVQSAEAGTLPPPPVRKRLTVADLKKELDELKADVDDSVLGWLGELAVRLDKLEQVPIQDIVDVASDINARLKKLEEGSNPDRQNVAEDIADRLDNYDAAIGARADALTDHIKDSAATPQPQETEIEFAQPPQQTVDRQARAGDIISVASVCLTMGDVLTVCRALKADIGVSDQERNEILNIACLSSGVILTPGLQIRAGVKLTGA